MVEKILVVHPTKHRFIEQELYFMSFGARNHTFYRTVVLHDLLY